jgi:hypothetical protein
MWRSVKEFREVEDDAKIATFRATVWKDEADRRGSEILPTLENIIEPLLSFMRVQNWFGGGIFIECSLKC